MIAKHTSINVNKLKIIIMLTLAIVNNIIIFRKFIFSEGFVFYRDLIWPVDCKYFYYLGLYSWNPFTQSRVFLFQAPMHYFLSFLPSQFAERFIYILIIALLTITPYYVIYKLTGSVLAAIAASLVYTYNPVVINRMQHKFLLMAYALLPLILLVSLHLFRILVKELTLKIKIKKIHIYLGTSIVLALMSHALHFMVFGSLLLVYYLIGIILLASRKKYRLYLLIRGLIAIFTILITFTIIGAYFIFPYFLNLLNRNSENLLPYTLYVEQVDLFSRNADLVNVIRLTSYWYPSSALTHVTGLQKKIMEIILFAYPLLASASVLIKLDRELEVIKRLTLALLIVSICLASGTKLLGSIYVKLVFNTPLIGWMFRDPYKISFFISFSYSILIGLLFSWLDRSISIKIKDKISILFKVILLLMIITIVGAANPPMFTGDLNGVFNPIKINSTIINTLIKSEGKNVSQKAILLYPPFLPWRETAKITIKESMFYDFIISNLIKSNMKDLACTMTSTNIDYIALRKKLLNNEFEQFMLLNMMKNIPIISRKLKSQNITKLISDNSYFEIYKLNDSCNCDDLFYVSHTIILSDSLNKIVPLENVKPSKHCIAYILHDTLTLPELHSLTTFLKNSQMNVILVNYDPLSALLDMSAGGSLILILPYKYTSHYSPTKYWSRVLASDSLWRNQINKMGISNWQFDHRYGLAVTMSSIRVPSKLTLSNKDIVVRYEFNSIKDLKMWQNFTRQRQFGAIQLLRIEKGVMEVVLLNSTAGWKTINSPLISVKPDHVYRFYMRIRGVNVHKAHIKIVEFDDRKKLINVKYVMGIGSGTFNWKQIIFNYIPGSKKVKYIQLQIWHGHLTDKPLPNVILIDYIRMYDISKYVKHVVLNISFKVNKDDKYKIFIRYLENRRGGAIRVYIDDKFVAEVNTTSPLDRFVWRDLGTYRLTKGKHILRIENKYGFNVINIILLIPIDWYNDLINKLNEFVKHTSIVYVFEAESDMLSFNGKIMKNKNASNSEVLYLKPGDVAWRHFEVIRSGYYFIAIRLKGEATIMIDNNSFNVSLSNLAFNYIGPIYLSQGNHTISISATKKAVYLDVVWIYNVSSPDDIKSINGLFVAKDEPAKILSFRRINPTLWKIKVIARRPFMLVFAEGFDPLWEARVYRGDKLVERVRSIPVYGVINGFLINATGNLTIVIRFVPQDWFELGLRISGVTFALIVFYLVWDWRRGRGDRWALLFEEFVRRMLWGFRWWRS